MPGVANVSASLRDGGKSCPQSFDAHLGPGPALETAGVDLGSGYIIYNRVDNSQNG